MNADAAAWMAYARENAAAARLMAEAGLLNPSLQNSQQAVEKSLKALALQHDMGIRRTHSIRDLHRDLLAAKIDAGLAEEECELLDSIYVRSMYPGDSAFADFPPDQTIAAKCVELAQRVVTTAQRLLIDPRPT